MLIFCLYLFCSVNVYNETWEKGRFLNWSIPKIPRNSFFCSFIIFFSVPKKKLRLCGDFFFILAADFLRERFLDIQRWVKCSWWLSSRFFFREILMAFQCWRINHFVMDTVAILLQKIVLRENWIRKEKKITLSR